MKTYLIKLESKDIKTILQILDFEIDNHKTNNIMAPHLSDIKRKIQRSVTGSR